MPKAVRIVTEPTVVAVGHLVRLLWDGTRDMRQLAEECGLAYLTVQRYCAAMHRAGGIHVHGWRRDARGAPTIRIYKMGPGVDAEAKIRGLREKAVRMRETRRVAAGKPAPSPGFAPMVLAQLTAPRPVDEDDHG